MSKVASTSAHPSSLRTRVLISVLIFLFAFGIRVLSWHDTRLEVGKVQTVVVGDYKRVALLLRDGGIKSFFSPSSPLADLNNLGHPPGYSILIAFVYALFGPSDTAVQFVQIICDALAAVVIFLIVAELLAVSAGVIAGMLAAFSPQFTWNSVLLLPDSISVLPILIAIYLVVLATRNPRWFIFAAAGGFIGISCWLRPNAMLLTFFVAVAVLLISGRDKSKTTLSASMRDKLKFVVPGWRYAGAVVCGALLIILPLTLRNAIVFRRFIPISLGAGQTLLEGLADYDDEGRLGIPRTDMGIMKQEAEIYNRPDYYSTLFNPDGVERERARLSRGLAVVRSHPLWFSGVMVRRATSMVRLERARLISADPRVTHSLEVIETREPVLMKTPDALLAEGVIAEETKAAVSSHSESRLNLNGDTTTYGQQYISPRLTVNRNVDYVVRMPVTPVTGRMKISVQGVTGTVYSSAIVEADELVGAKSQRTHDVRLPFVANSNEAVQVILSNEASNPSQPVMLIGALKLYELGPSRFLWTRYPRMVIGAIQKPFLTAVILPLAILGLFQLILRREGRALVILSVVPIYFFLVQSIVHTEYRYILAIYYFLFAFAGIGVATSGTFVLSKLRDTLGRTAGVPR